MGLNKQGYYTLSDLIPHEADFNIILSGRSIGKSYATEFEKKFTYTNEAGEKTFYMGALRRAWETKKCTLAYVRRRAEDIKGQNCAEAFTDKLQGIIEMTKGECNFVTQKQGYLWLAHVDDVGKITNKLKFGKVFAVSEHERYKSRQFPDITDLLYEEFVTEKQYLPDEPTHLQNLISTISRSERRLNVFLIANTINQNCPYFSEWGLVNIPKQKIGTIDTYYVKGLDMAGNTKRAKICVEYCESKSEANKEKRSNSQVFIGKAQKSITGGAWQTDTYPHLSDIEWELDEDGEQIKNYDTIMSFLYICNLHKFVLNVNINNNNGGLFLYVYPAKQEKSYKNLTHFTRDFDITNYQHKPKITDTIPIEVELKRLINSKRVCFSDNLTGQNFYNCLQEFSFI